MDYKLLNLKIDTNDIAERVYNLTNKWISRSQEYPFFTLGRSAYLDGKTPEYIKDIRYENSVILGEFGDLIEYTLQTLEEYFHEPINLSWDLRCPGFHIFPSDPVFIEKGIAGNWHKDFPHETLGLGSIDPYTFTIPIEQPASGAGIDYLDKYCQMQHIPYEKGCMILHDGTAFHRIAGLKEYVPNEYRITMQGHLIRRKGRLEAFW